jgi:indolepyruvate ferredoxin oxidoreductase alpha subunit
LQKSSKFWHHYPNPQFTLFELRDLILGCGVKTEHLLELEAKKQLVDENAARLKTEIEYRGLSVVIFRRECLEALRKQRKTG